MITVDTSHKLLKEEVSTLRQLIGKTLTAINCSGVDLNSGFKFYDFIDSINLRLQGTEGFTTISATFDETNFGDDFININIKNMKEALGIKRHDQGGLQHPFANLNLFPEFRIKKIEVYGDSYTCESANIAPKPYWNIEIKNPGEAIVENIETENILLFYSDNGRLLIKPYGAVPWIQVSLDNEFIDKSLFEKDRDGKTITKLKHELK